MIIRQEYFKKTIRRSYLMTFRSSGSFQTVMPLKNVDPGLDLQASQDRPAQHTPSGGTHRRCSPRVAQQSGVQCASKGNNNNNDCHNNESSKQLDTPDVMEII